MSRHVTAEPLSWEGECIMWPKKIRRDGYGAIVRNDKQYLAHRVLWIESGRRLPQDHVLHHLCFQKACVNLDHLVAVTPRQHFRFHRHPYCPKCGEDNYREMPSNKGRECRTCTNRRRHERRVWRRNNGLAAA